MAASLRETRAGATASPDLRRSSRRRLAPSSSSAATSLFDSEQRGQPLRYVVSPHGPGDEHTLRVRLRPVTEDFAAEREEEGGGTGGGHDRSEGGRNRGGRMLRQVRSRLRDDDEGNGPASLAPATGRGGTGREGYEEPPLERLQAVIGRLLDEVAAADDYQILPSISVGRDGENVTGGGPRRSGRTGGSGNGAVTWTGILARNERPGGYDSVEEVETEVRLLLQGLVRSHETIYVAEGRRILNDLPRMMREALDEA
jgi:hypothetical protein